MPLIIKYERFFSGKKMKFLNDQNVIYLFDSRDVGLINLSYLLPLMVTF